MRRFALALLFVFALAVVHTVVQPVAAQAAEPVMVASGAGYKKLVTELAAAYEKQTGQKLELVFGNMGQVVAQAKGSGKIQVIIGERGFLEHSGLAFSAFHDLGRGALVLAWPKGRSLAGLNDLAGAGVARVAMPDPKKAIYGVAGTQALEKAGLTQKVQGKLLVVATVPQVTTYLVLGEVDAGLTNLTDVMDLGGKIGGYLKVDPNLYAPVVIGAGVLSGAGNAQSVGGFTAFLASPQARAIVKKHGL